MAKVAIIVVNYRTPWHLDKCLQAVFQYTSDFHLFLVHNSPDADSIQISNKFKEAFPDQITVITHEQNLGLVAAINSTYDQASRFERVCFLNSDTIVTNGWLAELNRALDENPNAVQASPDSNSFYPESFIWNVLKRIPYIYRFRYLFPTPKAAEQSDFAPAKPFWLFLSGFCNLAKVEPFLKRGHFCDPNIVHGYWDDFEMTYYLRQFGEVGATNKAYVFHFLNASLDKVQDEGHNLKNKLMLLNGFYVMNKYRDRLKQELASTSKDELFANFDNYVLKMVLSYFGITSIDSDFQSYIETLPAREVGQKFLK